MESATFQPRWRPNLHQATSWIASMRHASKLHAQAAERRQKPDQIYLDLRNVFFEFVPVMEKGRRRRMPRIEVYCRNLNDSAAAGDTGAFREQMYILRKLEKAKSLQAAPVVEQYEMATKLKREESFFEFMRQRYADCFLRMQPEIIEVYSRKFGEQPEMWKLKPYWLQFDDAEVRLAKIVAKVERKARRGLDFEIGRGKPPLAHRWVKGQISPNPAGRPRSDGYDSFRDSLSETITIRDARGKRQTITKYAAAAKQMLTKATKGDRQARRHVRDMIDDLERHQLFTPPAAPPARRSKLARDEFKRRIKCVMVKSVYDAGHDLRKLFEQKYGALESFVLPSETFFNIEPGRYETVRAHFSLLKVDGGIDAPMLDTEEGRGSDREVDE